MGKHRNNAGRSSSNSSAHGSAHGPIAPHGSYARGGALHLVGAEHLGIGNGDSDGSMSSDATSDFELCEIDDNAGSYSAMADLVKQYYITCDRLVATHCSIRTITDTAPLRYRHQLALLHDQGDLGARGIDWKELTSEVFAAMASADAVLRYSVALAGLVGCVQNTDGELKARDAKLVKKIRGLLLAGEVSANKP